MSVQDNLDTLYPGHRSPDRAAEWEALKQRLTIGQPVTGRVVAKSPFGAWVDLGVGFPALLEIVVMADLTPERYRAGDWCPVGSEVTANVAGFRDDNRQVGLWQVPHGHARSTPGASGTSGLSTAVDSPMQDR
jgi:ribosomal protein S1